MYAIKDDSFGNGDKVHTYDTFRAAVTALPGFKFGRLYRREEGKPETLVAFTARRSARVEGVKRFIYAVEAEDLDNLTPRERGFFSPIFIPL